jgi:TctA family transporter
MMLLGIALGFIVGILPGLGGAVTLALMLPFVFDMDSVSAFGFLLGMLVATGTAGDMTSILFGIPGETTSAAVIPDGHGMAKRGEAGRALGAALCASLIGGLVGAVVLVACIPIVRPLVLSFGTPEMFMLAVLGISFVGILSAESPVKGLLAAGLGLVLSTIGMDPQTARYRYTFDVPYLFDGLDIVVVVIGLFAVPECIDLAVRKSGISRVPVDASGSVSRGILDTFRHWGITVRCSLIGTFVGIIPGLGISSGQWVAYAHAIGNVRDRSSVGHGAVEGVLGPSAANNSVVGGALLPLLAFGIPGNVVTAILFSAFLITGLTPGPDMLTSRLHVTFSMIWTVVLANIIAVLIGFALLKPIAKLTLVKGSTIVPFIVVLIFLGAFGANNNVADLVVAMVFGLIGLAMVRLDWPRAPLILALVLGKLAEINVSAATIRYGAEWLWRPPVIGIFMVILAVLFYPIYLHFKGKRIPSMDDRPPTPVKEKQR